MSNRFDEMRYAVDEAKFTLAAADSIASDMSRLLVGRLKHCPGHILKKLKKELRDFNMATREWKNHD